MKKLLITFLLFNFNFCYMHHANVSGDIYGAKGIIPFTGANFASSIPVRIEFDPKEQSKIADYLKKKGVNIEVDSGLIQSYYSEEIISKFKSSRYFSNNPDANMKIRIFSTIEEVKDPVITLIPFILTLGLFPTLTRSYGTIEFELFDTQNYKILKTYKYPIEHRFFFGSSSIFLAPIFGVFSERFDHSKNQKTFAIMRVAFQQFEEDLLKDLEKDKNLLSKFFIDKTKSVAIIFSEQEKTEGSESISSIYTSLESGFLDRGMLLVERRKIKSILNEIKLSQIGITDSSGIQVGKLLKADRIILTTEPVVKMGKKTFDVKFGIRCIEVESGKILWSEFLEYNSLSLTQSNQNTIKEETSSFIATLRRKGNL